ncbi:MAG TPA: NAD-dependent epimerase/dehydratase family protein [Alphaproteobacteria bacterium]|nr:NAD-dependent epimerase/dehydratase family protein [Alphaproteobacteria bacterium]
MKILLTGGRGMVGSSFLRQIKKLKPDWEVLAPTREQLDLTQQGTVREFLRNNLVDCVIHAAAKVGGIKGNAENLPEFLIENSRINTNVIQESFESGVKELVNLGSSCMYPKDFHGPLKEEDILAGPLEPTNEGYALAKISAERLCRFLTNKYGVHYKTIIPCNLYGKADRYDAENGHLMAAIIEKIALAIKSNQQTIEIWGTGETRREFVYVDDLTGFIIQMMGDIASWPPCLNIGMGQDHTVNEYYQLAANALGYKGNFAHNHSQPSGMKHKLMDCSKAIKLGWNPKTKLEDGMTEAYKDYQSRYGTA